MVMPFFTDFLIGVMTILVGNALWGFISKYKIVRR